MFGAPRSKPPLVSIITVVLNARKELIPLIESVAAVKGCDTEFIVIDGGSVDGTVDLLREQEAVVDYWISAPDKGIYDAMNRGIAAAQGEYIFHLNAGDRISLIPRDQLVACLSDGIDVAAFRVRMDGKEIFQPKTGFLLRIDNTWHHQGTFYKRSSHLGYDTSYRVFGDMNFNQRMLKAHATVRLVDDIVCDHRNDGISMSGESYHEVYRSIRTNFGTAYLALAFAWFKYKGLRQRTRRLTAWLRSAQGIRA